MLRREPPPQTSSYVGEDDLHPSIVALPQVRGFQCPLSSQDDEDRLLALGDPRMKAFIVTMLDSACRPGELRTLQWNEVDLTSKEIRILPGKSKTGVGRDAPLSDRAMALLEMRQYLPDGKQMPGDAYVFGNDIGEQMSKDVLRNAWDRLRAAAGLEHLHLADLRHEAASRYDELDVPTAQISKLLGHASLTTTTRYVNPTKKALRRAVGKLNERNEAARLASGLQSHQPSDDKTEKASEVPAAVSHSTN